MGISTVINAGEGSCHDWECNFSQLRQTCLVLPCTVKYFQIAVVTILINFELSLSSEIVIFVMQPSGPSWCMFLYFWGSLNAIVYTVHFAGDLLTS